MITICAIPKPFPGRIGTIQRNALRSWRAIGFDGPVLLLGDEAGTAEAAAMISAQHVQDVPCNEVGTPLLNGVFELAERHATTDAICYVNADILFLPDMLKTVRQVCDQKKQFLVVGQRYDLDIEQELAFADGWEVDLQEQIAAEGQLEGPTHIDYFIYNRRLWRNVPPFAIGRFCWDNWLIYHARQNRVPVIDATASITAIHQRHDYSHAVGGYKGARFGKEAKENRRLAGDRRNLYTIWDSSHVIANGRITQREGTGFGGGIWSYRRSCSLQMTVR